MPSASWANGWLAGDVVTAAEFKKGVGAIYDSTASIAVANFDITPIVATYAHLRIECYLRGDTAATSTNVQMRFNNDSGANYNQQWNQMANATATGVAQVSQTVLFCGYVPAATAPANALGVSITDVVNYAGAANFKPISGADYFETADTAAGQTVIQFGGLWKSTAAINRITILPSAGNWVAGSRVTIYAMGA